APKSSNALVRNSRYLSQIVGKVLRKCANVGRPILTRTHKPACACDNPSADTAEKSNSVNIRRTSLERDTHSRILANIASCSCSDSSKRIFSNVKLHTTASYIGRV